MPPLLLALIGLALFFTLLNGFRDSSNIVATLISSRATSPAVALALTAVAEFSGPLIFGVAVARTIGNDLLAPGAINLDLIVAALLIRLLGWHWAFLPTLAAELIPGIDLFPTWTAAVWFVTRRKTHPEEPEILPPGPAPDPRQ